MSSLKRFEKDFLNYIEGTLSEEEKARFEAALSSSEELQADLQSYRRIVLMEKEAAREHFVLDERFVSKVMAEVKYRPGFLRKLFMEIRNPSRPLVAGLASLAVISLGLTVFYSPEFRAYQANRLMPLQQAAEPALLEKKERAIGSKEKDGPELLEPLNSINEAEQGSNNSSGELTKKTSESGIPLYQDLVTAFGGDIAPNVPVESEQRTTEIFKKQIAKLSESSNAVQALVPSAPRDRDERGATAAGAAAPESSRVLAPKKELNQAATEMGAVDDLVMKAPAGLVDSSTIGRHSMPYPPDFSWQQKANTERYGSVSENVPTLTSDQPVSTFSIDVDTGSYTNVRRFLQQGQLPPSDAVRVEEFINYFDYSYPHQGSDPFSANFEAAPSPDKDGKFLLKIGIKAQDASSADEQVPWNLVFLVDVSGSMNSPDKLPLVQKSLELLTNKMRPGDKVSIVTYAGSSGLLLPPTEVGERSKILSAIAQLSSGGSTHGSAGIMQAYQTAKDAFIKGGSNRVILATDGDFNVGMTNQDELIRLIEEKRKGGITLTTLGFGSGNYNEAMMEQLANKGNGNYFYIDTFKEARKVFEESLHGTIQVVAKDVKLQIEFNPKHVAQYRLLGYENRKLKNEDFANDRIDAGEIGVGHTVTALYEIVLVGTDAANNLETEHRYTQVKPTAKAVEASFGEELAFLKIRFKEPEGDKSKLLTFPLLREKVKQSFDAATSDFRFVAAVSAFAHKLRQSQYAPELSFKEIASISSAAVGEDKAGHRREFVELVRNVEAVKGGQDG